MKRKKSGRGGSKRKKMKKFLKFGGGTIGVVGGTVALLMAATGAFIILSPQRKTIIDDINSRLDDMGGKTAAGSPGKGTGTKGKVD